MFGRSPLKTEITSVSDRAAKQISKFGILNSLFGDFLKRVDGKKPDLPTEYEKLSATSSSSTASDESVKQRLILRKRSSQNFDEDKEEQYTLILLGRFLCGVALTQFVYIIMTYQSEWNPKLAAIYSGVSGFFVSLGLAFSVAVRSVIALILPTLCTSKGRSIVLAFCLLLLLAGPTTNIIYNYQQLSSALTCGDELAYNMTRGLSTLMANEQNLILSSMDDTIDSIIEAVQEAEQIFISFAERVDKFGLTVRVYRDYLKRMGDICEAKLGAFFCIIPRFVSQQAKIFYPTPLYFAIAEIQKEFLFNLSYTHDFVYEANVSKTSSQITKDIMEEVEKTTGSTRSVFGWIKFFMTFSSTFIFIKAIRYRSKYLTNSEFDNYYITDKFIQLDKKQEKKGKASVLPLKAREIFLYVRPGRIWLSKNELKKFAKGFSFLTFNFIYTIVILLVDYGVWRLMSFLTLSLSLRNQSQNLVKDLMNRGVSSTKQAVGLGTRAEDAIDRLVGITAIGGGFMAMIYRAIASGMEKIASAEGYEFRLDKCLPKARLPDYEVYYILLTLYALMYIICLFEAYLLRLRRRVMASYYPKREQVRVLYLRTKVLANRGFGPGAFASFVKNAALDIQRHQEAQKIDFFTKFTSRKGLLGMISRFVTGRTAHRCLVCGLAGSKKHGPLFQRCTTFGCKGIYCKDCYHELHRTCMICLTKESKRVSRDRRSGTGANGRVRTHRKEVEFLLDSSGISDSSASSDENEEEDDDEFTDFNNYKEKESAPLIP